MFPLLSTDYFRPPDWRWHLAGSRLLHSIPGLEISVDQWVDRATAVRAAIESGQRPEEVSRIGCYALGYARAYELWRDDNRLTKTILEARLLAGESVPEIAKKLNMPMSTVSSFEALFFNVARRLDDTGYILVSLGPGAWGGEPRTLPVAIKTLSYYHGAYALDAILHFLTRLAPKIRSEVGHFDDIPCDETVMRAALAARLMPADQFTLLAGVRAMMRLLEMSRGEDGDNMVKQHSNQIALEEYRRVVEADPDAYDILLRRILGVELPVPEPTDTVAIHADGQPSA